ncbi:MAG TPA: hypothetical protein VN031_03030 [Candidatus Microsaccharimonas sp.]|nr:hypothetical protein [Candidatus Microsaccharimonas sp.]
MITLRKNQGGALDALLLPLIAVILLLILSVVFGVWAYGQMQDYKNNSDQKSAVAVNAAIQKEDAKKAAEYNEASKSPVKTYTGPAAFGSLQVQYPKTWSAYVAEQTTGSNNVDGYFNPNFVPSVTDQSSSFALRVRVLNQTYANTMQTFQGGIKGRLLTAAPYAFAKVPKVIGTRLDGKIAPDKQGTMIVMPLRANTLEVWTESSAASSDFTTYVLPNLTFSP